MEGQPIVEENILLQIVPEEMWDYIFGYLNSPSDLKNLLEVSNVFNGYLQTRKPSFLFPDVVKILIEKNFLEPSDVIKCRLLDTHIKQAVDSTLEKLPKHFKSFTERDFTASLKTQSTWEVPNIEHLETSLVPRLYNHKPEKVGEIMEKIKASEDYYRMTNTSPFPSRHLFLEERCQPRESIHLRNLFERQILGKKFLDVTGKYFWHCDMRSHSHGFFTLSAWYRGVVTLVKRMPNLKSFFFHYPWANQGFSKLELKQLCEILPDNPFPNLPALTDLIIKDVPECVITAVLQANKHVKALKLEESPYEIGLCDCLESLSIHVKSSSDFHLCTVGEKWRISKLELLFAYSVDNITGKEIFDFLHLHEKYLTHLQLRLPMICDMTVNKVGMLQLPNLVELRLILTFNTDIDFIGELSSLRELYIQMNHPYEKPVKNVRNINFDEKYFDKMLESNIWMMLPKLRYVEFTVVTSEGLPTGKDLNMVTHKYSRAQLREYARTANRFKY